MRTQLQIQNLTSEEAIWIIRRSLSRLMDIRIDEFNLENHKISVTYSLPEVLEKIKIELRRIGYPIQSDTDRKAKKNLSFDGHNYEDFKYS